MAHAKRCFGHRVFCRNNIFYKLDSHGNFGDGLIPRLLGSSRQQLKVYWLVKLDCKTNYHHLESNLLCSDHTEQFYIDLRHLQDIKNFKVALWNRFFCSHELKNPCHSSNIFDNPKSHNNCIHNSLPLLWWQRRYNLLDVAYSWPDLPAHYQLHLLDARHFKVIEPFWLFYDRWRPRWPDPPIQA